MTLRSGLVLLASIGVCLAVGWIGSNVTEPALVDWYPSLRKPAWTPPDIAFPIVWTVLYVLMGVAAWLVWRRLQAAPAAPQAGARHWLPPLLFALQLALNSLWSTLFFGWRAPGIASAEILLLIAAIVATMAAFRRVSRPAALLLAPYLMWVVYAAALNLAIWRMNA